MPETREEVSLDISLDGGVTWKKGGEKNKTYQAAADFKTGNRLKLQANITVPDKSPAAKLEEVKIDYFIFPIASPENIHISGAAGEKGEFILGDTIVVEWDNSLRGDNNPDIASVEVNFQALVGERVKMFDDGPQAGHADKKAQDGIYTAVYALPAGINLTGNIYVAVTNQCGSTVRGSRMFNVDTR